MAVSQEIHQPPFTKFSLKMTYLKLNWVKRTMAPVCICPLLLSTQPRLNWLAPWKFECNFRYLVFQIISVIDGWVISFELTLRWMSLDLTDDNSTLVQVMAWCRQATSHYLNQCWPRSLSPYGVTRPQKVNIRRAMSVKWAMSFNLLRSFYAKRKWGHSGRDLKCINGLDSGEVGFVVIAVNSVYGLNWIWPSYRNRERI